MSLKITRTENSILVQSPYSPDLPARAKTLSGRWNGEAWSYPIAAEEQVRSLYMDIYGEWDISVETVTLICVAERGYAEKGPLTLGGRIVARAWGRDSGARTGDGVIILDGGFCSGGSMKNWVTRVNGSVEFKLIDVARSKAQQLIKDPEWCDSIEIEEAKTINRDALIAEKEALKKRIAEIDAVLEKK